MLKGLGRLLDFGTRGTGSEAGPSLALSAEDLALVVPMVKALVSPPSGEAARSIELPLDASPVTVPFAADMVLMYAVDRDTHLQYVSNQEVAATGLSLEELHNIAVKNLPGRLGEINLHDCGEGMFGLSAGGTFEASLLLVDGLWDQLADHLPGEPLAAVPSRDLLFVIGSARPNSAERIAEKARIQLEDDRYAISSSVLVRRNEKWVAATS